MKDVRDAPYLNHEDVLALNFIREPGAYVYRRHYRTGLRSHIMEVLRPADVAKETGGAVINGMRCFPKAEPLKMLRIFRTKFKTLKEALEELHRVNIIQSFLHPHYIATSQEFLVDYVRNGHGDVLLCGLQEYVKGEILEPWSHLDKDHLVSMLSDMGVEEKAEDASGIEKWIGTVRQNADRFVNRLKQMITTAGYVPDLAGVGNLILTPSGHIRLVDINNISRVSTRGRIPLDDKGYPVCDKSIKVIWHIEHKLVARAIRENDPIYETFLDPERLREVKALEEQFQQSMALGNDFA